MASGKHNCHRCDKKCNDRSYSLVYHMGENVYLGRLDKSKSTTKHYCSQSCQDLVYITETLPKISNLLSVYIPVAEELKMDYRKMVQSKKHSSKVLLQNLDCVKLFTMMNRFLTACVERKNIHILMELKYNALHTTTNPLEDLHSDIECVDLLLKCRYFMEHLNLEVIAT